MQQPDQSNSYFHMAAQFVQHTHQNLFLTGKAGTGKTTFLRYIKIHCPKKLAILAPTGVAAINAGGNTLHSFFQLPFGTFIPGSLPSPEADNFQFYNKHSLLKHLRLTRSKRELIQELELLIIDEVSMVRADLLDAVDSILRQVRRQGSIPFGGVQMLYIGDLSQLPPVVKEQEWKILSQYYQSPFFFHSTALQEAPPLYLELKKIYRQRDETFIGLLNNIRNNELTQQDIDFLNQFYNPSFKPNSSEGYITLTTHNARADLINQAELKKLPGRLQVFEAEVEGDFNENAYPADYKLQLKEGAQVMFIRNDKGEFRRFYNGKIGTIKRIKGQEIYVTFPDERGELLVEKETWRNVRYQYDKEKDQVQEEEIGTFSQFPLRLAWAITIHKSQGLTFQKAIIDAGDSFAAGQVYVALSRLVSLDGLVLYSRINAHCISTDEKAKAFSKTELEAEALGHQLKQAQKEYIHHKLVEAFNWQKLIRIMEAFSNSLEDRKIPKLEEAKRVAKSLADILNAQQQIADKFTLQLQELLTHTGTQGYVQVHQRSEAAVNYFCSALEKDILSPLQGYYETTRGSSRVKKYLRELKDLKTAFSHKKNQLEQVTKVTAGLLEGKDPEMLLNQESRKIKAESGVPEKEENKSSKKKTVKGESRRNSLNLFKAGKSIEEIAVERELVPGTIEGHLVSFIPTGEVQVLDLVSEEKLAFIQAALKELGEEVSSSQVKEVMGDEFSYGEIKAVMVHQKKEGKEKKKEEQ